MEILFIVLSILSFNANAIGFSGQFKPSVSNAARVDQFKVTCGGLATDVYANIQENMPIQSHIQWVYLLNANGVASAVKRDATDGDNVRSQLVRVDHIGNPTYLTIHHDSQLFPMQTNPEWYIGDVECKKADGTASTTSIQLIVDQ